MKKYFYLDGSTKFGPCSKEELKTKNLRRSSKIWYLGLDNWTKLSEISELEELCLSIPPELALTDVIATKETQIHIDNDSNERELNKGRMNNYKVVSLFVVGAVVLGILIVLSRMLLGNPERDAYKEIVANAFDADEDFTMYVEKFYRDLEYHGIFPQRPNKRIIRFSRLDQIDGLTHIHGISYGHGDNDRIEIYINPSSWEKFNKPMRYFIMYHELSHDVLNLDDLEDIPMNQGKLMYPMVSSYEGKTMDDFIESFHTLFAEQVEYWN